MKITKKKPLRPRGRSDEKRQSTKDAIREVYANGPQKEVQIIPAKKDMIADVEKKKLRVCASFPAAMTPHMSYSAYTTLRMQKSCIFFDRMLRVYPHP